MNGLEPAHGARELIKRKCGQSAKGFLPAMALHLALGFSAAVDGVIHPEALTQDVLRATSLHWSSRVRDCELVSSSWVMRGAEIG